MLEREPSLETPAAAAEREVSRTAYTDLAPGEAELLLQQSFPEQLEAIDADPSRALSEATLEKVYSPTEALVSAGGETMLLESSTPVQAEEEDGTVHKVELGLEPAEGGGYAPANPLVDVGLPENAAQPISVGDEGLALTYEEGKAESSASLLDDEDLFLAEADRDTSLLLSPVSAGVEISAQLLSADSPEQLSFAVSLPEGAKLVASDDGGAAVVGSKGETLDRVTPPDAVDAQGTAIPASLEVAGDTIILSVPHRELSVAYPIDLDPTIEEAWVVPNLLGIWHWQEAGTTGGANSYLGAFGPLVNQPYNEHWGAGAYVRSRSNVGYGAGSFGRWWYEPQGQTTYIHRAVLWGIHYEPGTCTANEPHPYVGIWNGGGWSVLSNAYPSGWATGIDTGMNLSPGARTVFVGIEAAGTVNLKCAHEYALTGASFFLDDPENPTVSSITGNPSGWISGQSPPFTINVGITDPGLGVKRSTFSPEGNPPQQTPAQELGCTGAWASQCPAEHVFGYALSAASFDQGEKTVKVTGVDALAKSSNTAEFTTKVDRTPPEEELKGQLTKAIEKAEKESGSSEEAPELTLPVYNLEINATDGVLNPANGGEKRSGVKSIEVFLDKGTTPVKTWTNASCPNGNCTLSGTYTLKLNELSADTVHTLRVLSTDFAGNKPREETLEFEYIPSTGIKNEDAMQYFPLPNGQGHEAEEEHPVRPELAVNLVNGNLVYRQKDIDVEGPNADLEVERFYNSLLPNSQNSEFGDGWTLAQTPTLEPQEAKAPNPPTRAAMVEETGAVQTAALPAKTGEERFDKKMQSVVTKESGGYSVEDLGEGMVEGESIKFNEAGEATELQTPGYASVEYNRSGGLLSEIAVEDPSVVAGASPGKAAAEEAGGEAVTYRESFGSAGTGKGQFQHPGDVAADPEGGLWVADTYGHRLEKFNSKGQFQLEITNGSGEGKTMHPSGVSTDAAGNVYEADWSDSGVYEYSKTGAFIRKLGSDGSGNGQFRRPEDVAVDSKGNVIVADTGNGRLVEFNSKGEFVRNMGTKGAGAGQIGEPTGIDVDSAGNIFVADWTNNKVVEFSEVGSYIRQFGEAGTGTGQFNRPDAIAVDNEGHVYVGDQENDFVKEFSEAGEYIRQFGGKGSGPGQLNLLYPMGIDIYEGGLWVTDTNNNRVERWSISGEQSALYLESTGSGGTGESQFQHPGDVAVDPEGDTWVADTYGHRLEKLGPEGEMLLQVTNGSGEGKTMHPSGVSTDAAGNVYEADWSDSGVYEYSKTGAFIRKIGTVGEGLGQVYRPEDVAVDSKGNVIVADTGNGRLVEFNAKGEFLRNMGTKGKGTEQLGEPTGIDVDAANDVFVADWTNNKVMEYNEAGAFVRKWGEMGSGNSQFNRPDAIAADGKGHVFVGDQENSSVKEFTETGEFIRQFGSHGSGPGQLSLSYPMGIDASNGSIWVTDPQNNRIQHWGIERKSSPGEAPGAQADASVAVTESSGLVQKVEGKQAGTTTYAHVGELLTAVKGTEGETRFEYESGTAHRMTKVTLPNGTYAEIAYEPTYGRVSAITVSIAGSKKTTHFEYTDSEPRKTKVIPETEPAVTYEISANGFIFKSWNAAVPPTIDFIAGTLHDPADLETASPIGVGTHNLSVQAHSAQGIVSMQVIANGSSVVKERLCEHPNPEAECKTEVMEWVTETADWPAGILYLEVIITDRIGHTAAERFWVNMPYTPLPNPEEEQPPRYSEILSLRQEYGLDLDLHGNDEAINDRIFNVMGDWNNPHTPAGEVARATTDRWGEPLSASDAAEMEFRQSYVEHDIPAIELWSLAHFPTTYAGTYVDNAAGGIIHVGFTQGQEARLTEIEQQVSLTVPPSRLATYPAVPTVARLTAVNAGRAIDEAIGRGGQLSELISETYVEEDKDLVQVGAKNVATAEALLNGVVGAGAPVSVFSQPEAVIRESGRNREVGRMDAGDRILYANNDCTAGFGASEVRGFKSNGAPLRAVFVLTAGHCGSLGEDVGRSSSNAEQVSTGVIFGSVSRTGAEPAPWSTDIEGIRTEAGIPPNGIYRPGRLPKPVGFATVAGHGNHLCFSGYATNRIQCGEVVRPAVIEGVHGGHEIVYLVRFKSHHGDSGAPVWNADYQTSVGSIIGRRIGHPDETFVAPLLHVPGVSTTESPGALRAPGMFNLSLIEGR